MSGPVPLSSWTWQGLCLVFMLSQIFPGIVWWAWICGSACFSLNHLFGVSWFSHRTKSLCFLFSLTCKPECIENLFFKITNEMYQSCLCPFYCPWYLTQIITLFLGWFCVEELNSHSPQIQTSALVLESCDPSEGINRLSTMWHKQYALS